MTFPSVGNCSASRSLRPAAHHPRHRKFVGWPALRRAGPAGGVARDRQLRQNRNSLGPWRPPAVRPILPRRLFAWSKKHESRLGRGGFGKLRRMRDPRPPECTGGTKIEQSGSFASWPQHNEPRGVGQGPFWPWPSCGGRDMTVRRRSQRIRPSRAMPAKYSRHPREIMSEWQSPMQFQQRDAGG
jgi:hypothetical protein